MAHIVSARRSQRTSAAAAEAVAGAAFSWALLLALQICSPIVADGSSFPLPVSIKSACPHKSGYQVIYNGQWDAPDGTETVYSDMATAQTECDSDTDCVAFNNFGTIVTGTVADVNPYGSVDSCVYIKGICPAVAGYTAFNHSASANRDHSPTVAPLSSYASSCSSAGSGCMGFTYGDFGGGAGGFTSAEAAFGSALGFWAQGKCFYMKNDMLSKGCVPKYGYTVIPSKGLGAMSGSLSGAGLTSLSGGAAAAESFCKTNPRCRGWDNQGQVAVGGFIYSDAASDTICTYTKDACPPRAGFTSYADLTDTNVAPSARNTSACAADMYTNCLNNPACQGFDTLRYIWTSKPTPTSSYPGMCTYVRLPGF